MFKNNIHYQRITQLRSIMQKKKLDAFLVSHEDEHLLEATPKNYERLNWLSGFTGSAGYLVVTIKNLFLFVDGRYTIQAKIETKGLKITIFNIFEVDLNKFILLHKMNIKNLALDNKTISQKLYQYYLTATKKAGLKVIKLEKNLLDLIWKRNLNTQNTNNIFLLKKKYCGQPYTEKINLLLKYIKEKKADSIFIQNSESVAWLYNLRGNDLPHNPITFAYTLVSDKFIYIFLENPKLHINIKKNFSKKIRFVAFSQIQKVFFLLKNKKLNILTDPNSTSKFYYDLLSKCSKTLNLIDDPILHYKSIKNKIEIKNVQKAHIIDGVALTKFIFWIKNSKEDLTELDIVKKID
ncbi:MAG: hypothetical protein CMP36_00240, partial [Rickettsiales bacterium]